MARNQAMWTVICPWLIVLGLTGCSFDDWRAATPQSLDLTVVSTPASLSSLSSALIAGRSALIAEPAQLGRHEILLEQTPTAPLVGWLVPIAVPSPDGSKLIYHSWRPTPATAAVTAPATTASADLEPDQEVGGIPTLRLHDLNGGGEQVLMDGAQTVAWRSDGAIAYFQGSAPAYEPDVPYVGHIMVRPSLTAEATRWTVEAGRYLAVAWAGGRLIAYRERPNEQLDVLVLDGPGQIRELAHSATLIALSPDASRIAVEHTPHRPLVELLDIADGKVAASLDLHSAPGRSDLPAIEWLSYAGDWSGQRIVARGEPGLVQFRTDGSSLQIERVFHLDESAWPAGLNEPHFAASQDRIVAWTDLDDSAADASGRHSVVFSCAIETGTCQHATSNPGEAIYRINNPSYQR